jgi:hypothetical protein
MDAALITGPTQADGIVIIGGVCFTPVAAGTEETAQAPITAHPWGYPDDKSNGDACSHETCAVIPRKCSAFRIWSYAMFSIVLLDRAEWAAHMRGRAISHRVAAHLVRTWSVA